MTRERDLRNAEEVGIVGKEKKKRKVYSVRFFFGEEEGKFTLCKAKGRSGKAASQKVGTNIFRICSAPASGFFFCLLQLLGGDKKKEAKKGYL